MAQLTETLGAKQDHMERLENAVKKFADFDDDAREVHTITKLPVFNPM